MAALRDGFHDIGRPNRIETQVKDTAPPNPPQTF
jgi:hypothetical protein